MPQRIKSLKHFDDGPEVLLQRPRLAAMIAVIAARWTRIDNLMAKLFSRMLGREEEAALAVSLELRDRSPRESAFQAVARTKLDEAAQKTAKELFEKIRKKAKTA